MAQWRVARIVDGDTVWVQNAASSRLKIRIAHIDAPELRGRCARERALAIQARAALQELLPIGAEVALTFWDQSEKHGRVLASVTIGVKDVGGELRRRGLALPWHHGRGPKPDWCAAE